MVEIDSGRLAKIRNTKRRVRCISSVLCNRCNTNKVIRLRENTVFIVTKINLQTLILEDEIGNAIEVSTNKFKNSFEQFEKQ